MYQDETFIDDLNFSNAIGKSSSLLSAKEKSLDGLIGSIKPPVFTVATPIEIKPNSIVRQPTKSIKSNIEKTNQTQRTSLVGIENLPTKIVQPTPIVTPPISQLTNTITKAVVESVKKLDVSTPTPIKIASSQPILTIPQTTKISSLVISSTKVPTRTTLVDELIGVVKPTTQIIPASLSVKENTAIVKPDSIVRQPTKSLELAIEKAVETSRTSLVGLEKLPTRTSLVDDLIGTIKTPVVTPNVKPSVPVKPTLKVDELIGTIKPTQIVTQPTKPTIPITPITPITPSVPITPITPSVPVTPLVPATPSVPIEEPTSKKNTNLILLGLGGLAVIYFLFLRKK